MPYYINMRESGQVETIDEFETRKEAREMLAEYRFGFNPCGLYPYLSTRCTKDWRDDSR